MVSSCHGVELSWCRVVMVLSCKLAGCQIVEMSWWRVVRVASCHGVELKGGEL
jgi:hypothetical protein